MVPCKGVSRVTGPRKTEVTGLGQIVLPLGWVKPMGFRVGSGSWVEKVNPTATLGAEGHLLMSGLAKPRRPVIREVRYCRAAGVASW